MATRELDDFLKQQTAMFALDEFLALGREVHGDHRRMEERTTDPNNPVQLSNGVPQGVGDFAGSTRIVRHVAGDRGIHARGGFGQRGGVYRGPFSAVTSPFEGEDSTTILIIKGPVDLWAALLLTIERDSFGHDPRPRAADEARASLMACLDEMDPKWRTRWNH
jgi:hypothetical protein